MTNVLFLWLAVKGINNCLRNDHDRIFIITFVGYFLVGSGSFLFHTTLKCASTIYYISAVSRELTVTRLDPMQLVDELSMIYTTCLMFYATFSHNQKPPVPLLIALFLVSLSIFITGYYHYLQDPTFHQNAYALLTAVVVFRSIYVMEVNIRPRFKAKHSERANTQAKKTVSEEEKQEQRRQDVRDAKTLRTMWAMIGVGLSVFIGGFGIWTLDNVFCSSLRHWRREIGLPWGILLEGHGWW